MSLRRNRNDVHHVGGFTGHHHQLPSGETSPLRVRCQMYTSSLFPVSRTRYCMAMTVISRTSGFDIYWRSATSTGEWGGGVRATEWHIDHPSWLKTACHQSSPRSCHWSGMPLLWASARSSSMTLRGTMLPRPCTGSRHPDQGGSAKCTPTRAVRPTTQRCPPDRPVSRLTVVAASAREPPRPISSSTTQAKVRRPAAPVPRCDAKREEQGSAAHTVIQAARQHPISSEP